jgi:polysaccharide deacetylase family protein (PEP-CTERM system associated)
VPGSSSPVVNGMSVDVEDYYHVSAFEGVVSRNDWDRMESRVEGNTDRLLALFDEFSVRSTFFVLGWVAERYPALIRRIAAGGHEIASHGYAHRLVYADSKDAFRADLRRASATIEDASGQRVTGYRAPSYSITRQSIWALDVLIEEGYAYDSSIFPIRHDRYGIPASPRHPYRLTRTAGTIVEAPASTVRRAGMNLPIAGGGYFRLLPYRWTQWGMSQLNVREGRPAIFYIHPWEVDPAQPRLAGSALSRFRHYRNLDQTESRLRRLLTDFRFSTIRDVLAGQSIADVAPDWAAPVTQQAARV